MAARPKSVDGLNAAGELVNKAVTRLSDVVAKAEAVIASNPKLNAAEVSHYKDCIRTAKKQITVLGKLASIPTPAPVFTAAAGKAEASTPKRGRPAKAKAVAVEAADAAPKRRGRPPKAKVAVLPAEDAPAQPKRRGRPPKIKTEEAAPIIAEAPRKRGRPAKVKIETIEAIEARVAERLEDTPRRRGRPKGSKNKPKVLNGVSAEAA